MEEQEEKVGQTVLRHWCLRDCRGGVCVLGGGEGGSIGDSYEEESGVWMVCAGGLRMVEGKGR